MGEKGWDKRELDIYDKRGWEKMDGRWDEREWDMGEKGLEENWWEMGDGRNEILSHSHSHFSNIFSFLL